MRARFESIRVFRGHPLYPQKETLSLSSLSEKYWLKIQLITKSQNKIDLFICRNDMTRSDLQTKYSIKIPSKNIEIPLPNEETVAVNSQLNANLHDSINFNITRNGDNITIANFGNIPILGVVLPIPTPPSPFSATGKEHIIASNQALIKAMNQEFCNTAKGWEPLAVFKDAGNDAITYQRKIWVTPDGKILAQDNPFDTFLIQGYIRVRKDGNFVVSIWPTDKIDEDGLTHFLCGCIPLFLKP